MKITLDLSERGSGKTSRLIERAHKDRFYIVVANKRRASEVFKVARGMDLHVPFPITFSEFRGGHFCSRGVRGFLVDDVDELLVMMGNGAPVVAMSMSSEAVELAVEIPGAPSQFKGLNP